jgi:hypothetical protein
MTPYSTLKAQALDYFDAWTRGLLYQYQTESDASAFTAIAGNYHWALYSCMGLAGIATYSDDARGQVWYDYWRNHMHKARAVPYVTNWFGSNGNQMDAFNYLDTANFDVILTLLSNATAMGDDLTGDFPWVAALEFYKHNMEPNGVSQLTRGLVEGGGTPPCTNCYVPEDIVQYLADYESLPLANKFRSLMAGLHTANGVVGDFLWWNPTGTQTAWSTEPTVLGNLTNPAGGYGNVYMRSDWTSGAVYADFYGHPEIFSGAHDHADFAGSLLLQRGSNTLLVNPAAEYMRNYPSSSAGAGATMLANASNGYDTYETNDGVGGGYYQAMLTAGNPSTSTTVASVTLSVTSAAGAVLTMPSTTGVTTGMIAIGANIPGNAYVLAVTSTTVILNQSVTGAVSGNVVFATIGSTGSAQGGGLWRNYYYSGPGDWAAGAGDMPVCTGPGTPWAPGLAFTVTSSLFSVTLVSPLTDGWGNGTVLMFSTSTAGALPAPLQRGVLYLVKNWTNLGSTATFNVMVAPTNRGLWTDYPTTGTTLTITGTGTGSNWIEGGTCNGINAYTRWGLVEAHPAHIDLLESTTNYAYARGVGLEADYYGNNAWAAYASSQGGRVLASQREVLYLTPKLFLIYDRTMQNHWNGYAANFSAIVDAVNGNPAYLVAATHGFSSGMQVVISGGTCASGSKSINGQTYTVTVLDANNFALNGVTTPFGYTCTGTATGNLWGHQVVPWHTSAIPTEVTTGGQIAAGMRQWHVKAPAVSIATISNTTPVVIATSTPHNLNSQMSMNIAGVTGACAALNGTWTVTIPNTGAASDLTNISLNGSTACGTGTVGSSTVQKFNGAITTIKPATPPVVLSDFMLQQSTTSGAGYAYRLEIHDPRNCTSNASWCLASGADTADSQNWLTALDASVSASDTATLTPLTATNADMVQVTTGIVAGFQNAQVGSGNCSNYTCTPPVPVLPISYTFTYQSSSTAHTLAGMLPSTAYKVDTSTLGSVAITASGSGSTVTSTANGVLAFTSAGSSSPPAPTITGLSPSSATAGGAQFTLTINGANYDSSCAATWNSTSLATTYVGTTQCTAVVPALLIAAPGTASVTVTTTGGGTSSPSTFTINATSAPTISSLSPATKLMGSTGFTLTVNGANYDATAVVYWNGTPLVTTYVGPTQVTAPITAGMVVSAGTFPITVSTTTSGATSSPYNFSVNAPFVPSQIGGKVTLGGKIQVH